MPVSSQSLPREAAAALCVGLLAAVSVISGASVWMPPGRAGIDHLVVPSVCFPLVWLVCGLGLFAAPDRRRARIVVGALSLLALTSIFACVSGVLS